MPKLAAAQERFVDDMGAHMLGWGLPRTTGRVWAYLLLRRRPASLDEITADLDVAKSGASVATRQLLRFGLARSAVERGGRRLLFSALYTPQAIFQARTPQAEDLVRMLREGARVAPSTRDQLSQMAEGIERIMKAFAQIAMLRDDGTRR